MEKAYQLEFQRQLEKQISGILDNLQGKNFTSIADYLNTIPFTTTDTKALEIRFNRCLDTDRVISAIRKGMGMAKCPSDRCKLDVIHPKVDPSCTDIHFVTDM